MNRMYHIKKYIEDRLLKNSLGQSAASIDNIILLFLEYLDKNNMVYGEGEFHRIANDEKSIIDERVKV